MARGRAGRWYSLVVLLSAIALGSKAARSQPLPNPPQLQADGDEMLCAIALNTLAELEARLETTPLETLSNQEIANLNQSVDTLGNTINRHCPPDRANTRDPQDAVSADGPSNRPARPEPLETHDPEIQDATPAETISDTPPAPSTSPVPLASSTSPAPLPPRAGIGYNGATHEGNAAFGRLEGFIPLRQNPGGDLTFLEGRILLDNDANLGSNALLGHRAYNKKDNRIYGGYLSYDTRNTEHRFFQQIGLGFESLGDIWDIRTNFYIPIGDVSQQADVDIFDTGLLLTDTRFFGNNLFLDTFRQRSERRLREAAVFSFEIEGGGRIAKLGQRGDLRLYGGPYYYSPPGGPDVVGWRTRLVARPTEHLTLSLGGQTDALFGTNLLFQIGVSFPSGRPKGRLDRESRVLARLGDFVERNNSITIDQQESRSFFQEELAILARNPATGEPWFFNHVTLGRSGGNGTFENPFGTVQDGLNTTRSDGNDIVYVAQGNNPGIPAFTIPDRVQVLSRGPVQTIPVQTILQSQRDPIVSTTIASPVQLPFSNSGNFPLVTDTVTMGNDSVLSGFTINPPAGSVGVLGNRVRNVEIRDNRISATGDDAAGIRLTNPSGTATITNNQIDTTGNSTNTDDTDANFLASGAHGIEIDLTDTTLTSAAISGNTIATAGNYAVGLLTQVRSQTGAARLSSATIASNTVSTTGTGAEGIQIAAPIRGNFSNATIIGGSISEVTLSDNTVSTQGDLAEGIEVALPISLDFAPTTTDSTLQSGNIDSITISGNRVSTRGEFAQGIDISQPGGGSTSNTTRTGANIDRIAIADNTVSTQGEFAEGIYLQTRNGRRIGSATISGNTVSIQGESAEGISVAAEDDSRIDSAVISGNRVSTQGEFARGISVDAEDDSRIDSTVISGNTVSTRGESAEGIYVGADDDSRIDSATISGNTVSTQGESADAVEVRVQDENNLGSATISGNTVSTAGEDAHGLYVRAEYVSSVGSATISGNTVSTTGVYAYGIYIRAQDPNGVGSATITGNTISTAGEDAYGIYIRAQDPNSVGSATITGNTISTQGQDADGIYIRAEDPNSVGSATLSGNTVSTAGDTAHGVRLRTVGGASACFSVSGNRVTTQQATANPFNFEQSAGSTFKILDTNGTTLPQTMANNTAIANGGATQFQLTGTPFTTGTSCP